MDLWLWDTVQAMFGKTAPAQSWSDLMQGRALQQAQATMPAALLLGPRDPASSVMLEGSVMAKAALWSLQQAPVGELYHGPYGFWSRELFTV